MNPKQLPALTAEFDMLLCRCRVPHSVEASASLIEIELTRDLVGEPTLVASSVRSDEELRLMYSMSILRFVNGIVDSGQQAKFATPVSLLAEKAALPSSLVDIRHAATHNQLPSLPNLKHASQQALEWLRTCYWGTQSEKLTTSADAARSCLREYVKSMSRLVKLEGKAAEGEGERDVDKERARSETAADMLSQAMCKTPAQSVGATFVKDVIDLSREMFQASCRPSVGPRAWRFEVLSLKNFLWGDVPGRRLPFPNRNRHALH